MKKYDNKNIMFAQNNYLNKLRISKEDISVYLVNGIKLDGKISCFDDFSIMLETNGEIQVIMKLAISTFMPKSLVEYRVKD